MKKLISKFALLAILAVSITSCEKSPLEDVEVTGTGATTIELARGAALSATGTTGSSVVTINYVVGEKLFPSKVIPKLIVYYLTNTKTGNTSVSSSVRTPLFTATNVALVATSTPGVDAPVVTAIGSYGNASNIVWGLKYTFNLSQLGTGLLSVSNGAVSSTRGTSIIIVAQDAGGATLAEYTTVISEFGLRTI
jgi:hypothetical protein